jgi:ABC-2 type transport system ATP-binding protein
MNALETIHVSKEYANKCVLDDVNIAVPAGSVFGLLGPNGAGKTTLIRIINQITAPDRGQVLFMQKPLHPEDAYRMGYLPEERGLYRKMEVGEQALYLARLKGMSRHEAMEKLKHWFVKFEIQSWWNKKLEELSKGMQQKVQFITTVVHNPELLILDEPFSGFDPINAQLIAEEILAMKEKGCTIVLSTHNMSSVESLCDHIALINKASVVLSGRVRDIKKQYATHTFEIGFKGSLLSFSNAAWGGFELLTHRPEDDMIFAVFKLMNNNTISSLLAILVNHVEICHLREVVPGMNEIFLRAVREREWSGNMASSHTE